MKMGVHKDEIATALGRADAVFMLQPEQLPWEVADITNQCVQPGYWHANLDRLVDMIVASSTYGSYFSDV